MKQIILKYCQKNKDKRTNNDLQNTTEKNEDRATQTGLKTGGELRCSWRVSSPFSIRDTRPVTELRVCHHSEWVCDCRVPTSKNYVINTIRNFPHL